MKFEFIIRPFDFLIQNATLVICIKMKNVQIHSFFRAIKDGDFLKVVELLEENLDLVYEFLPYELANQFYLEDQLQCTEGMTLLTKLTNSFDIFTCLLGHGAVIGESEYAGAITKANDESNPGKAWVRALLSCKKNNVSSNMNMCLLMKC